MMEKGVQWRGERGRNWGGGVRGPRGDAQCLVLVDRGKVEEGLRLARTLHDSKISPAYKSTRGQRSRSQT